MKKRSRMKSWALVVRGCSTLPPPPPPPPRRRQPDQENGSIDWLCPPSPLPTTPSHCNCNRHVCQDVTTRAVYSHPPGPGGQRKQRRWKRTPATRTPSSCTVSLQCVLKMDRHSSAVPTASHNDPWSFELFISPLSRPGMLRAVSAGNRRIPAAGGWCWVQDGSRTGSRAPGTGSGRQVFHCIAALRHYAPCRHFV